MQQKGKNELILQQVIGRNLKTARDVVADMSMAQVMKQVWGIEGNKNRLSEIENGARMPSPYVLLKLSMLYGVSLDYIFGMSHDIDRDLEFSRAGQIVQGLREIACDMVDKIGLSLAEQVNILPRMDAVTIKDKSMQLVHVLRSAHWIDGNVVINDAENLKDLLTSLEAACFAIERTIGKHSRIMELAILDHIDQTDKKVLSRYMTAKRIEMDQLPGHKSYEEELRKAQDDVVESEE